MPRRRLSRWAGTLLFCTVAVLFTSTLIEADVAADHIPYQYGDVFAGVVDGKIKRFDTSGALTEEINTTSLSSQMTGMCFTKSGAMLTTNFGARTMTLLDTQGRVVQHPWGPVFQFSPESCVLDAEGNVFVGTVGDEGEGAGELLKLDPSGNVLATFKPELQDRGVDWIDLAADNCTLFYTSEDDAVKRFDVCTDSQLPDFASSLEGRCLALRILVDGDVIPACSQKVYRFAPDGTIEEEFSFSLPSSETQGLFALNVDPDGQHFWTATYTTGSIYRVDIDTGQGLDSPVIEAGQGVTGLAVYGEITVAAPTPPPVPSTQEPTPAGPPVGGGPPGDDSTVIPWGSLVAAMGALLAVVGLATISGMLARR